MENMTFKEKSTWLSLVATLYVFGRYLLNVMAIDMTALSEEEAIGEVMSYLSSAVFFAIVIAIIFQSLIAAAGKLEGLDPAVEDERDKLIAYKANNSGYWVLAIGVFITLGQLLLPHAVGAESTIKTYFPLPLFEMHVLLFAFILSEIVRFTHQIILYRRDAV
jgi:uncharacterized membrane protein